LAGSAKAAVTLSFSLMLAQPDSARPSASSAKADAKPAVRQAMIWGGVREQDSAAVISRSSVDET
jgi:hypothetical protein